MIDVTDFSDDDVTRPAPAQTMRELVAERPATCDDCGEPLADEDGYLCFDCAGQFCTGCWNSQVSACCACANTDPGDRARDREDNARHESAEADEEGR